MMLTQRLLTALAVALLLLGEIGVEGFAGEPFAEDPGTSAMYAVDLDGANLRRLPQIPKYTVLGSPDISPDGRWIGLDGWKQGEGTSDARLLFVELETKEFRDLGPGAMPTWSGAVSGSCTPATRRAAYLSVRSKVRSENSSTKMVGGFSGLPTENLRSTPGINKGAAN